MKGSVHCAFKSPTVSVGLVDISLVLSFASQRGHSYCNHRFTTSRFHGWVDFSSCHAHPNSQLEYCLHLYSSVTAHLTSTVYWYFLNSKSTTATAANLSISDIMLPRFPFYNKSLNIICILSCLPLTGSASKK